MTSGSVSAAIGYPIEILNGWRRSAGVLMALFALTARCARAAPYRRRSTGRMSAVSWCLTAGFAGLVVLGFPFAIAIALAITAALLLADIEPAFLAQA